MTTMGRCLRMSQRARNRETGKARRARTRSAQETRLRRTTGRRWRGYPARGPSRLSIPRGVPTNTTLARQARTNSSATLRAGKRCPPVPPPVNSTVLCSRFRSTMFHRSNVQEKTNKEIAAHEGAASVAYEGQSETFGRQETDHDPEIKQGLEGQEQYQAETGQSAEIVLLGFCPEPGPDDQDQEHEHDGECAEEAEFFSDRGEDEVGMGFGKIEQLLFPIAEPDAEQAAAMKTEEGLDHLEAGV